VYIDEAQLQWFALTLAQYPAEAGWKVFVFTHAPPMGSGLRVLQNVSVCDVPSVISLYYLVCQVHVKNGCAWLNHAEEPDMRRIFIELTKKYKCIKVSVKSARAGHAFL
jgi:hypothetical protein